MSGTASACTGVGSLRYENAIHVNRYYCNQLQQRETSMGVHARPAELRHRADELGHDAQLFEGRHFDFYARRSPRLVHDA